MSRAGRGCTVSRRVLARASTTVLLACVACMASWPLAHSARAEFLKRPALHWVRARGAEQCIDARTLARRVEALTGPVFVSPSSAERSVEGAVRPLGRGFEVRIVSAASDGAQIGERVLSHRGRNCRALDEAITFVIALTVDPELAGADAPPEVLRLFAQERPAEELLLRELEATPEDVEARAGAGEENDKARVSEPNEPTLPVPTRFASAPRYASSRDGDARVAVLERYRQSVSAGAAALTGALPGWPFGIEVAALFDAPSWTLALSARVFPPGSRQRIQGGESAAFSAYELALTACPISVHQAWARIRTCLGPTLGQLRAEGKSFEVARTARLWDPALVAGFLLGVEIGAGIGLMVQAWARLRLGHGQFVFRQSDDVFSAYRPARLGALFSLGPFYEF